VQWLRDGLGIIKTAHESDLLTEKSDPTQSVYLVPAFVGLGAPYWDAQARAAIFGLTRNSGGPEIARAALDAVGYQTRDLLEAMRADWPQAASAETVLRVDGGMVASDWTMQFLSDMLDVPVDRPTILETTALGAVLAKRFGVQVASDLVPSHPTLGDVDSPQALADYQAAKRAHKAEWKKARAGA